MWVVCSGYNMSLLQGLKAEQMEAATKSLEARLQASEQTTELIKTFSSPQVSAALLLHSPPQPHLHTPHSVTSHPRTQHLHTHLTPCLTHIPPPPPPCPRTPLTLLPTPHSITSHPRTPLLYTRSKKFSPKNKKDLGMACHIPPLKKAKKQGKCHYPASVPSYP